MNQEGGCAGSSKGEQALFFLQRQKPGFPLWLLVHLQFEHGIVRKLSVPHHTVEDMAQPGHVSIHSLRCQQSVSRTLFLFRNHCLEKCLPGFF